MLQHRPQNTTEHNNALEVVPNSASIKGQIQAKNVAMFLIHFLQGQDFNHRLLNIFKHVLKVLTWDNLYCNMTKLPFTE